MAMVVAPSTQERGIAEIAHDVRIVVKHTFLDLVEDDEMPLRTRPRSFSDPNIQFVSTKCDLERRSRASTEANDTDDDIEQLMSSDDESVPAIRAPPGVWNAGQPVVAAQTYVPVCVAFVPVIQQPIWPQKSSRSARRRRARAVNRWFRYNMQSADGEQQEEGACVDDIDGEFDDDWQSPEDDDMAESLELEGDSWPVQTLPCEVDHKKTIKA